VSSRGSSKRSKNTNLGHGNRGGGTKGSDKMWDFIGNLFRKAQSIREDLEKFEKYLADAVLPLTELQDKEFDKMVLDKFSTGEKRANDTEELQHAIERI